MEDFLYREYLGNTVKEYLIVLGSILLGIIIVRIFKRTVLMRVKKAAKKTVQDLDDYIIENVERFVIPAVYYTIIYYGIRSLDLSVEFANALSGAYTVVLTYYGIRLVSNVVRMALRSYVKRQENGEEKLKQVGGIIMIINSLVWSLGIVFLFDNLGYDVTAIITGLGIGGIAIALAAQNILGDLFNYFVIFFDRPFEIGDFLVIDDKNGIVDKIGIKTTRIKTLSGEELVVANSDLTNSRIHNYKKMERRRILFTVGVTYESTYEQIQQIPQVLKEIVESQSPVTFDRAHFKAYGDSSLDFEVVYYVEDPAYNLYMDIQQQINFGIYKRFEEMELVIAFPTRTLYVRNETDQKFKVDMNKNGTNGAETKGKAPIID